MELDADEPLEGGRGSRIGNKALEADLGLNDGHLRASGSRARAYVERGAVRRRHEL